MTKLVTFILVAMFVVAFGCGNKTEEKPPVDESAATAMPEPAAPEAKTGAEELTPQEAIELEKVYVAQAQSEITPQNAEAIADALAKEIEADLVAE